MPKISVIIPAYNSEGTLAVCLTNLVRQTLWDIEIIIVNDCSTDGTWSVIAEFEAKYPDRIIAVNSDKNRGAGGARNVGLSYASGEYIGFVDSDDIVTVQMYEKLYNKAQEGDYDIVDCGYYNEATDTALVNTPDEAAGVLNDRKRNELIAGGGYFWSRIFKKSFLDEINIHFRENCILEDFETLMLTFAKAHSIGTVKEILYCYKNYDNSLSKCTTAAQFFKQASAAIEAIYGTMSKLPNYQGLQKSVEYSIVNLCAQSVRTSLVNGADEPEPVRRARFKKISSYLDEMVRIPFEQNEYIIKNIATEDIKSLKTCKQM